MANSRMGVRRWIILAVLSVCFAPLAHAQYRAGIQGTVLDPQGRAVPGATVTLTNLETTWTKQVQTDSAGRYAIVALLPGHYSMTVEKAGFKKKVISDLDVTGEQVQALNVTLALGSPTQSVTVTAAVPTINTESGTIAGTITSRMVQDLPSFGGDVFQLAQLAPGVFGDGAQSAGGGTNSLPGSNMSGSGAADGIFKTENAPQIVANGAQNETNGISLNGVSIDSVTWGGAAVVTPSEQSVQAVKVISNAYDAEYGRYSGAHIEVVSKSGTDHYHGDAFFDVHRPGLNAYQSWNGPFSAGGPNNGLQKDTQRFNQFGGSLGGPIWKHKVFGFFSYEALRNSSTNFGTGWYETPQLDKMAPPGSIASRFLTYPGEGASYASILPTGLGPNKVNCAAIGLIEGVNCMTIAGEGLNVGSPLTTPLGTPDPTYGGTTTSPGVGNGLNGIPDIMFVNTVSPSTASDTQYSGRVDFDATQRDLVAFSIYKVPVTQTFFNGPNRAANFWHHTQMNQAETILWNHTFSPTLLNEARANAAGWRWNEINSNPQEPWGLPVDAIDNIGSAGLQPFGAPGPSVFDQWTYEVKDTLTKVAGAHMLKFGGNVTRLLYLDDAPWAARPQYNFRNLWDFLNDAPYQECCANFDPLTGRPTDYQKDDRATNYALFVQDNYKLRPNLTLNMGLRWDYFGPLHAKAGNQSTLVLGSGSDILTGMRLRLGGNLWQADKANFGPQFGFAWSPRSFAGHNFGNRLVLRGGYGIGYNGEEEAITTNGRFNPPFVSNITSFAVVYAVPSNIHSFDYPPNPSAITTFGPNNLPTTGAPVTVTGFPAHFSTPYTEDYSLEAQYDFGGNWVGTVGYQGSSSHHFVRQYNLVLLEAGLVPQNPMVNFVDYYDDNANGNFNALLTGIQHRFSNTFEVDASYRYSRCLDEGSQPYSVSQYEWNPTAAYGPCDYDVTHAFKAWGIWSPKIFRGSNNWLEKVAGGWTLGGILNAHSGFPWNAIYNNGNTCNAVINGNAGGFTCTMRPTAYLGGATSNYSNQTFMTKGGNFPKGGLAYFAPPSFVVGPNFPQTGPIPPAPGVARNSERGPRYFDLDATLSKAFGLPNTKALGENARFVIRANFYNLFNSLNLTNVDNNILDPYFGTAMNALGSRTVDIEGRFSF